MKNLKLLLLILLFTVDSKSNKIALTPPMGWMSWNYFAGAETEHDLMNMADAMVESGMRDVGYEYIIIDDLWQGGRDEKGVLFPNKKKFPRGIKFLADYMHDRGLKLGIYTCAAKSTCACSFGGCLGYEEIDAKTFASWGIDYVKCDYCGAPADYETAKIRYEKMAKALKNSGREMVFAVCEWGVRAPWIWAKKAGGHLWRTTYDIRDVWEFGKYDNAHNGIMDCLDLQHNLAQYSKPGAWNDMDMLVVGLKGRGKPSGKQGCSRIEYQSQMSLWCLLNSPLIASNNLADMDEETIEILTNKEIIDINQDKLGVQATRILKKGLKEIWAKPLSNGDWAVGFLNRDDNRSLDIDLNLNSLGFKQKVIARNVWKHSNIGEYQNKLTVNVKSHQVVVLRIKKSK
jgi:alpha-galactosidase